MQKYFLKTFCILQFVFFLFTSHASFAQNSSVRGFVYEKANGEPVLFINVYLKGTTYAGTTDVNGYFSISKVPAGNYKLIVSSVGYDSLQTEVVLKENEIVTKKLFLEKKTVKLQEVEVSAGREEQKTSVQ